MRIMLLYLLCVYASSCVAMQLSSRVSKTERLKNTMRQFLVHFRIGRNRLHDSVINTIRSFNHRTPRIGSTVQPVPQNDFSCDAARSLSSNMPSRASSQSPELSLISLE